MRKLLAVLSVGLIVTCGGASICGAQASDPGHQRVAAAQKALGKAG